MEEGAGPPGGGGGQADVASGVFSSAPFWCYAQQWHCKHPEATTEASFVQFSGPVPAAEVLQLYRDR